MSKAKTKNKNIEVKLMNLDELQPASYNPRQISDNAMAGLRASIKRFGLVDPIIKNTRTGNVIGGHQRIKAALQEGIKEGLVVLVDMPELEEKALNVALNNPHIQGEFTDELIPLLEEIHESIGDEVYEALQFDELLELDGEPEDGLTDPDSIPEATEPICKAGDLWQLGNHRLLCGDATKQEDVERLMDGDKADMVFTDPPYNVDYGSSKNPRHKIRSIENDSMSDDEWRIFCDAIFDNYIQYADGDIYMWGASSPDGMRMRLQLVEMGYHWSATIVWKKQQLVLSPAKYQRMYEPCFYGWKADGKSSFCGDRKQTEVWEIDRPLNSKLHPTMKPVELCEKGISNSSLKGASVLDLFGGSGSTLIACERLNRKCYMMEIDPHYCDVIIKRWEDFTGNKAVKL